MIFCKQQDCISLCENIRISPHLIVADPPYNYGQSYSGYDDIQPGFDNMLRKYLEAMCKCLRDDGSIFIFIPDEWVSLVDIYVRTEAFMHRRSWIVWYYTFGVNCKNNFTRSHTHILYFTKSKKNFTFNKDAVPSQRQLIGDKRAAEGGRHADNTWILHPSQLPGAFDDCNDVWLQSRICGTFKEREAHSPNQLPLALIERIVKVASNPGELVLDPFLGTGTTAVACKKLDRHFIGCDVSEECVKKSKERVLST
jgi:DNA modification methylase